MTPPPSAAGSTIGILLAAGEGRRMGRPKALMRDADGTSWLLRSCAALDDGGCDQVVVVLGARAEEARELLADVPVDVIVAPDWQRGMSASLRAGLGFLVEGDAALLHLVDLPDVGPEVVARWATRGRRSPGRRTPECRGTRCSSAGTTGPASCGRPRATRARAAISPSTRRCWSSAATCPRGPTSTGSPRSPRRRGDRRPTIGQPGRRTLTTCRPT
jgi:CTP:molybdopterin cytidylyltransferase MocA